MSAMCLCSRNQGQAANLLASHSGGGVGGDSVCNMGEIQSNTSSRAAAAPLRMAGNGFIRGKSTLILSVLTSILDVLHCVREITTNQ